MSMLWLCGSFAVMVLGLAALLGLWFLWDRRRCRLRDQLQKQLEAAKQEGRQEVLGWCSWASYWFTEDNATFNLLDDIAQDKYSISSLRERWRERVRKFGKSADSGSTQAGT